MYYICGNPDYHFGMCNLQSVVMVNNMALESYSFKGHPLWVLETDFETCLARALAVNELHFHSF